MKMRGEIAKKVDKRKHNFRWLNKSDRNQYVANKGSVLSLILLSLSYILYSLINSCTLHVSFTICVTSGDMNNCLMKRVLYIKKKLSN